MCHTWFSQELSTTVTHILNKRKWAQKILNNVPQVSLLRRNYRRPELFANTSDLLRAVIEFNMAWNSLGASQMAWAVKNPAANGGGKRDRFDPWVGKIPWRRAWQPTPVFLPRKIPWTEEPGRLQSIGSQRVRHNWSDIAHTHTHTHTHTEPLWVRVWSARFSVPWLGDHGGGTDMGPPLVHVSEWLWCL